MDRRTLLRNLGGLAAAGGFGLGCAGNTDRVVTGPPGELSRVSGGVWEPSRARAFAPVNVDPSREIRTVVGLRPFRPSGFRVGVERFDHKLVVHNYGHGGGGVTLSWGTALLAAEMAAGADTRRCAVIGCGAVGLATARIMQRRGWKVTIHARDLPPDTTSNIAGGQWSPSMVSDAGMTCAAYDEQFQQAARRGHQYFQHMVGNRYAVRWIENYVAGSQVPLTDRGGLADLYPDIRVLRPDEHPFGAPYAYRYTTMLVEMPVYLDALQRDFHLAGGRIVVRSFHMPSELQQLPEQVIFNCAGLGARELFGDSELIPVKGQLTVLLPQPQVDYIAIKDDLYMFPRSDGILLGGTHERGVETLGPNLEAKARILSGHGELFASPAA